MVLTDREVKRVVANYFKEKYKMDVDPKEMEFKVGYDKESEYSWVNGLDIGGIIDDEDN